MCLFGCMFMSACLTCVSLTSCSSLQGESPGPSRYCQTVWTPPDHKVRHRPRDSAQTAGGHWNRARVHRAFSLTTKSTTPVTLSYNFITRRFLLNPIYKVKTPKLRERFCCYALTSSVVHELTFSDLSGWLMSDRPVPVSRHALNSLPQRTVTRYTFNKNQIRECIRTVFKMHLYVRCQFNFTVRHIQFSFATEWVVLVGW